MFDRLFHKYLRIPYSLHVRDYRSPKKPTSTLLFIHGIGSTGAEWEDVISKLPKDMAVITLDLLGFGQSPHPDWAVYSVATQARSIVTTLQKRKSTKTITIVGHSLGSLIAIEIAKEYPWLVDSLVLCSPPFYEPDDTNPMIKPDELLRRIFMQVEKRPGSFIKASELAKKYRFINPAFNVTAETFDSYAATLRACIINQTSLSDVMKIQKPITIVYGSLDPFVIDRNIKKIKNANPNVKLSKILVGHEVTGRYSSALQKEIMLHLDRISAVTKKSR